MRPGGRGPGSTDWSWGKEADQSWGNTIPPERDALLTEWNYCGPSGGVTSATTSQIDGKERAGWGSPFDLSRGSVWKRSGRLGCKNGGRPGLRRRAFLGEGAGHCCVAKSDPSSEPPGGEPVGMAERGPGEEGGIGETASRGREGRRPGGGDGLTVTGFRRDFDGQRQLPSGQLRLGDKRSHGRRETRSQEDRRGPGGEGAVGGKANCGAPAAACLSSPAPTAGSTP